MCMNKSIMSPEFMSGALRSHKQTQFSISSEGTYYGHSETAVCLMVNDQQMYILYI